VRDISCKMRDAEFDVSFWDCPAKGGTGGHPIVSPFEQSIKYQILIKIPSSRLMLLHGVRTDEDKVIRISSAVSKLF
jgi:hypothetical protein